MAIDLCGGVLNLRHSIGKVGATNKHSFLVFSFTQLAWCRQPLLAIHSLLAWYQQSLLAIHSLFLPFVRFVLTLIGC
jgi:hypothetical protein